MSERSSIRGQVAVVTGGGAGIGAAVVERFAAEGARVVLVDRDAAVGAAKADELKKEGAEILFVHADVTEGDQVRAVFEKTLAAWGGLQILVNGAGGFVNNFALEEFPDEEWERLLRLNLTTAFLCAREAAPTMKKAGYGRVVIISSMSGRDGLPEISAAYSAAKAGLMGLTRRLAAELAPHGITVNNVAPGVVLSPRVAEMHKHRLKELFAKTPAGRAGEAAEIADAIWYLSTPGCSYITGVTLDVNGGRYMA